MAELREGMRGSVPRGALLSILALAGVAGAAGVALSAVAAHKVQSPPLVTAAHMLMIHAAAAFALIAIGLRMPRPKRWLGLAAVMLAAVTLFSGDVALSAIEGHHLFPFAAPVGGSMLILTWLAAALIAVLPSGRRN